MSKAFPLLCTAQQPLLFRSGGPSLHGMRQSSQQVLPLPVWRGRRWVVGAALAGFSFYPCWFSWVLRPFPRPRHNRGRRFSRGFDGAEDLAKHINLQDPGFINTNVTPNAATASNTPQSQPGYTTPYGANLYWNVGLEYRPTENWTLRIDGYNLAELFDDTLSKRNYFFRMSEFSVEAASLALSAKYKF